MTNEASHAKPGVPSAERLFPRQVSVPVQTGPWKCTRAHPSLLPPAPVRSPSVSSASGEFKERQQQGWPRAEPQTRGTPARPYPPYPPTACPPPDGTWLHCGRWAGRVQFSKSQELPPRGVRAAVPPHVLLLRAPLPSLRHFTPAYLCSQPRPLGGRSVSWGFCLPASPSRHSISEWRMQSIARDSDESSEDEFFDAHGRRAPGRFWGPSHERSGGLGVWEEVAVTCAQSWVSRMGLRLRG